MTDAPTIPLPPKPSDGNPAITGHSEEIAIRDNRALELRIAGASFAQVASALGVSKSTAHDMVQRALAADMSRVADQREEYRALQLARLERLAQSYWLPATRGREVEVAVKDPLGVPKLDAAGQLVTEKVRVYDYAAADRLIKVMERQARLLGLDAPIRVAVAPDTATAITDLMADLERMLADLPDDDVIEILDAPELAVVDRGDTLI